MIGRATGQKRRSTGSLQSTIGAIAAAVVATIALSLAGLIQPGGCSGCRSPTPTASPEAGTRPPTSSPTEPPDNQVFAKDAEVDPMSPISTDGSPPAPPTDTGTSAENGVFAFSMSTTAAGRTPNCGRVRDGGLITDTTMMIIWISDDDAHCVVASFARSGPNADTIGTVAMSCDAPTTVPCVEHDEVIGSPQVPAGRYLIHANGLIGSRVCWVGDAEVEVVAGTASFVHLALLPGGFPGCPTLTSPRNPGGSPWSRSWSRSFSGDLQEGYP